MKKQLIIGTIVLVVFIIGAALLYNTLKDKTENFLDTNSKSESQNSFKQKADDFTVFTKSGDAVKLSDFYGKPVVLNFWASWCPPCKSEMPHFENVYKEYGDNINFMMLDIVDGTRETQKKGQDYVEQMGYTFPVYFDNNQEASYKYSIMSIPMTFFIDSEGYIVSYVTGAISETNLRSEIQMLFGKQKNKNQSEYKNITQQQAKDMIDTESDIVILDVRTKEEYNDGHIKNAVLIPDYEINSSAESLLKDKNQTVLVYCRSGRRSKGAAKNLLKLGYTNVYDFGGIMDWKYGTVKE